MDKKRWIKLHRLFLTKDTNFCLYLLPNDFDK